MSTSTETSTEDAAAANAAAGGSMEAGSVSLADFLEQGFASALPLTKSTSASATSKATSKVLINCLDPGATNSISSRSSDSRPKWEPHISLTHRFDKIFRELHQGQIHQVPYQDARSHATTEIPQIDVSCRILESQVDLLHNLGEPETSTPQQIHTLPYCWMYFVTCATAEEYRTKVKPAINVFLSQLQDIYQQAGASADTKPSVLLVYCPTRPVGSNPILPQDAAGGADPEDPSAATTSSSNRPAFALANRLRQRMTSGSNTASTQDATSAAPGGVGDSSSAAAETESTSETFSTTSDFDPSLALTKIEKDIAKRLMTDFADGHHAVLTTLGNDYSHLNNHAYKKNLLEELQRGEWTVLLQTLGQAVVDGFQKAGKILQTQLDELNQDQLPASVGSANANTGKLFRLKSQWAFLHEPLHLPAQALLQYNELRALLPDLSTTGHLYQHLLRGADSATATIDELEGITGVRDSRDLERGQAAAVVQDWLKQQAFFTTNADSLFDSMQSVHGENYFLLAPTVEKYLWEREVSLLLAMGQLSEALERSFVMIVTIWEYQSQYLAKSKGDTKYAQVQQRLGEWSVAVCWDLKRAVQAVMEETKKKSIVEPLAKNLCQILEFARQQLRQLAHESQDIESVTPTLPYPDLVKAWDEWTPEMAQSDASKEFVPEVDNAGSDFVKDVLKSRATFVSRYVQLSRVAISLSQHAGRQRTAARLSMEVVAFHLERGELVAAAACLKQIKIYGREGWKSLNFGIHFRLAGLKRTLSLPAEYLAIIVACFGKRLQANNFSPTKALEVLHSDMKQVLSVLQPGGPENSVTFTNSPVFETLLKFSNPQPFKGRKALRRVFSIGETVEVTLVMTSHLAQSIDNVCIKAALVPYKQYVAAQEDGTSALNSKDALTVSLPETVTINPGENDFQFTFTPILSGQFVLSLVSAEYSASTFNYSYEKMKEPFRIDILPGEPSQSVTVNPLYLIPGHEQKLLIEFDAGEDNIEKGQVDLVCSPGLVILPENQEGGDWSPNCILPLENGGPGSKQVFQVNVKSVRLQPSLDDQTEVSSATPSVHAKVTTSYSFKRVSEDSNQLFKENGEVATSVFQNEIESVVPTLADAALTVDNVALIPYAHKKVVVSVAIKCHLPQQVILKKWSLQLPDYLHLKESQTFDQSILGTSLQKGETVSFSLDCSYEEPDVKVGEGALLIELQDEHDGIFEERLPLRLGFSALPSPQIPSDLQQLTVDARFLTNECRVGAPTKIHYELESSDLSAWKGDVYFKIDTHNDLWLVCGRFEGKMTFDGSIWRTEAVVIPTRPGATANVPSLQLTLDGNGLTKPFCWSPTIEESSSVAISAERQHSSIAFNLSAAETQLFAV